MCVWECVIKKCLLTSRIIHKKGCKCLISITYLKKQTLPTNLNSLNITY